MAAVSLECGLAGFVPSCLAWTPRVVAETRPIPVRVSPQPEVGAAHPPPGV